MRYRYLLPVAAALIAVNTMSAGAYSADEKENTLQIAATTVGTLYEDSEESMLAQEDVDNKGSSNDEVADIEGSSDDEDADIEGSSDENIDSADEAPEEKINSTSIGDTPGAAPDSTVTPAERLSRRSLDDRAFDSRFRAGKYVAGDDLPASEYMLFAYGDNSSLRIGITSPGSYAVSVYPFTYNHITVLEDGWNVTLENCYAIPINLVSPETIILSGPGMYKAGMHFAAGSYELVPDNEDGGSYTIYNTLSPEKIYTEGEVTANTPVRISSGQYIELTGCHFSKTPDPVMITHTDKETVRRVQAQLNMIDYSCGNPDGVLGSKTASAIKKYQEDHSLTATGKITDEFLLSLDTESPYSEVEAEMGPFITKTADFVSRYEEAVKSISETETDKYAAISSDDIQKGDCRPNDNGGYAFETNHNSESIRSVFYVKSGSFDRSSVIELSLMLYAADTSFKDLSSARTAALNLLFDGTMDTQTLTCSILDMDGSSVCWLQPVQN
ncbi:MAG: peptidoglycan-binding protein [Blautia sp.]|nr:peptidoglycan-binding protein [Blautia sp.]